MSSGRCQVEVNDQNTKNDDSTRGGKKKLKEQQTFFFNAFFSLFQVTFYSLDQQGTALTVLFLYKYRTAHERQIQNQIMNTVE